MSLQSELKSLFRRHVYCSVCGEELDLSLSSHYIAREPVEQGIFSSLTSHPEPRLFDAYDCPKCGSQYLAKIREESVEPRRDVYIHSEEDQDDTVCSDGN